LQSPAATIETTGEYVCPFFDLTPQKGGAFEAFQQFFKSSLAQQVTTITLLRQLIEGQQRIINGLGSADFSIFVKNTILSTLFVTEPPVPVETSFEDLVAPSSTPTDELVVGVLEVEPQPTPAIPIAGLPATTNWWW